MKYSRYNIFSRIRDSENSFIVNLLSGNADILNSSDAGKIEALRKGETLKDKKFLDELSDKGYIADESEEKREYRRKYITIFGGELLLNSPRQKDLIAVR
jgi:hypothetical protein